MKRTIVKHSIPKYLTPPNFSLVSFSTTATKFSIRIPNEPGL